MEVASVVGVDEKAGDEEGGDCAVAGVERGATAGEEGGQGDNVEGDRTLSLLTLVLE
jgi:hypothetical protein